MRLNTMFITAVCVIFLIRSISFGLVQEISWVGILDLQSRPKVVGTLELYHVSPFPPNQC